jgi:hypothetical protein
MQRGLYGGAKESEVIHEQLYISREAVVWCMCFWMCL